MVLKACTAPFETVKNQCVFFSGVNVMKKDGVDGGHGLAQRVLGGFNAPNTIDFALEKPLVPHRLLVLFMRGFLPV